MVFDRAGHIAACAQKEHEQIYPQPGWVEHDPAEIWFRTQQVAAEAMEQAGIAPRDLAAIGFKAVHAGPLSGTRLIDEEVLRAMEEFSFLAPAHNPPYIAG